MARKNMPEVEVVDSEALLALCVFVLGLAVYAALT